jgi:polyhydroxyalkanoate synthase
MNALERMARTPVAALEFANIVLTERDAQIAVTPKDVVWTHRTTTLYRYRSSKRTYAVPVLLVFALINRPDIFDLRPGNSFVEFLLDEGYDVFLLDWGVPDEADADLLEHYVCDEIPSALREVRRASGHEEATLLGWCIGGTLSLLHCALDPATTVRNLVLLTTPFDTTGSLYATWVARDSFDVDRVAEVYGGVPGRTVDWANSS